MNFSLFKKKQVDHLHTIVFYNLENLFDTENDPKTLDDDFTPNGFKKWTKKRYRKKLYKLARTISKVGAKSNTLLPVLIGVAEVENHSVIEDLIRSSPLGKTDYHYVHYDSPDERGIDTALIYDRSHFEVVSSTPIQLLITAPNGDRDTTRDILYVKGKLHGEEVHVFVNHWPSRRDGDMETDYKRVKAAETLLRFMAKIEEEHNSPNYIIMGDFNDEPTSKSLEVLMEAGTLYNPMAKLLSPFRGSASYRRTWSLFDQIIVSP